MTVIITSLVIIAFGIYALYIVEKQKKHSHEHFIRESIQMIMQK